MYDCTFIRPAIWYTFNSGYMYQVVYLPFGIQTIQEPFRFVICGEKKKYDTFVIAFWTGFMINETLLYCVSKQIVPGWLVYKIEK